MFAPILFYFTNFIHLFFFFCLHVWIVCFLLIHSQPIDSWMLNNKIRTERNESEREREEESNRSKNSEQIHFEKCTAICGRRMLWNECNLTGPPINSLRCHQNSTLLTLYLKKDKICNFRKIWQIIALSVFYTRKKNCRWQKKMKKKIGWSNIFGPFG